MWIIRISDIANKVNCACHSHSPRCFVGFAIADLGCDADKCRAEVPALSRFFWCYLRLKSAIFPGGNVLYSSQVAEAATEWKKAISKYTQLAFILIITEPRYIEQQLYALRFLGDLGMEGTFLKCQSLAIQGHSRSLFLSLFVSSSVDSHPTM